ncbi:hypothetical protein D3C78_859550 [compost metagenome]
MQALEVGHFWRVARFNQGFEASFDQLDGTTAQNSLLAEQVGFGLVLEGGFDDAGTAATDASGVGQGNVLGIAGSILVDRDQVRDTAAFDEFGTHGVTWRFWRDHDHVQVGAWDNLVVVDGETVGEGQGGALLDVRLDFVLVQLGLELVRGQDHDQVGTGNSGRYIGNFQAVSFGFGNGVRTFTQTDSDIHTGVFQVARLSVALGAVTDDGNFLALDDGKVTVFVVINFHENTPVISAHRAIANFLS